MDVEWTVVEDCGLWTVDVDWTVYVDWNVGMAMNCRRGV